MRLGLATLAGVLLLTACGPAAPPAAPAAADQALADPDLKADAAKAKLELNPRSGEQFQASISQLLAMPEPGKPRLKTILKL